MHVVLGVDASAFEDSRFVVERVVAYTTLVIEHLDVRVFDQLIRITITGNHDHIVAGFFCCGGERGDDVVGLKAGHLEHRDCKRLNQLVYQPELLAQNVGGRGATGFVVVVLFVTERRLGRSNATARWSGW